MSLQHWEDYYRTGALATGATGPDGGYDLEILQAWVDFLDPLPDGATLLDIGTGNGAIPAIAVRLSRERGRNWTIHGADLARIDPMSVVPDASALLGGVHFHPGVAAEQLPFDDQSMSAVSGHYALEYTEMPAALAQVHRVLKPGGQAQFIVHHNQSVLVHNARLSLAQADYVLRENKVYRHLRRLVSMQGETQAVVQHATDELRGAIQALKQAVEVARKTSSSLVLDVSLDAVHKLLTARTQLSPAAAEREVDKVEQELRASVHRLNDLVSRAQDEQAMNAMIETARSCGFSSVGSVLQHHAGDNLVGWRLNLHRA